MILICGSRGFIGRNIYEQLKDKYTFLTPTRNELDFTNIKAVKKYFQSHSIDTVIYAINCGDDNFSDNVRCFDNVVACKKYFRKMIFLGSGAEYDKSNSIQEVEEEESILRFPMDNYGLYKTYCSFIVEKNDWINLRLFGVFGKYEDWTKRFISQAINKNLAGQPITINKNVYYDYIYIDDLIRIIDYFITHTAKFNIYNVGSGRKIDLITIATIINNIKWSFPIKIKTRGLQNEYTCNIDRLMKEISPFEFTPIEKAIQKLYIEYEQ